MTLREAAKRLGLSRETVRRRIAAGKLGARRDGDRIVITEQHIRAYLRRQAPATPRRAAAEALDLLQAKEDFPGQSDQEADMTVTCAVRLEDDTERLLAVGYLDVEHLPEAKIVRWVDPGAGINGAGPPRPPRDFVELVEPGRFRLSLDSFLAAIEEEVCERAMLEPHERRELLAGLTWNLHVDGHDILLELAQE